MSEIKLEDIQSVFVWWPESTYINEVLCCDDNGDINKEVDPVAFDEIVRRSSKDVDCGYDKTVLTIKTKDGVLCDQCKFNLTKRKDSLLKLIEQ
jgi:hypothetical protein